jgi:hypothetical protein
MTRRTTAELATLARVTVEKIGSDIHRGGSLAYAQLLASELYEALQRELSATPATEPATRGLLAAAADQCRRSADATLTVPRRLAELEATLALLEHGTRFRVIENPASSGARRAPWPFRVIDGGLSRAG